MPEELPHLILCAPGPLSVGLAVRACGDAVRAGGIAHERSHSGGRYPAEATFLWGWVWKVYDLRLLLAIILI